MLIQTYDGIIPRGKDFIINAIIFFSIIDCKCKNDLIINTKKCLREILKLMATKNIALILFHSIHGLWQMTIG